MANALQLLGQQTFSQNLLSAPSSWEEPSNWSCREVSGAPFIPPALGSSLSTSLLRGGPGLHAPEKPYRPGPICPGEHEGGSPNRCHIAAQLPTQDQPQRPREMSHPQATCLCAQLGAALTQSSGFTSPSPMGTPTACRPFTCISAEAIYSPRKEKKLGA